MYFKTIVEYILIPCQNLIPRLTKNLRPANYNPFWLDVDCSIARLDAFVVRYRKCQVSYKIEKFRPAAQTVNVLRYLRASGVIIAGRNSKINELQHSDRWGVGRAPEMSVYKSITFKISFQLPEKGRFLHGLKYCFTKQRIYFPIFLYRQQGVVPRVTLHTKHIADRLEIRSTARQHFEARRLHIHVLFVPCEHAHTKDSIRGRANTAFGAHVPRQFCWTEVGTKCACLRVTDARERCVVVTQMICTVLKGMLRWMSTFWTLTNSLLSTLRQRVGPKGGHSTAQIRTTQSTSL